MTGGGDRDRLSELSDDLLRRILYFVPSDKAVLTSLLSRRWRSLWRLSGAVNLAVQIHNFQRRYDGSSYSYEQAEDAFFKCQEEFVLGAKAALAAAEAPITRLTLRVESNDGDGALHKFLRRRRGRGLWDTDDADLVGDLVSHQAARHVEELSVAAAVVSHGFIYFEEENRMNMGVYELPSLPSSESLRVLDLTRCDLTAAFRLPRLATLRLSYCSVEPKPLQDLLDASPELTTVQLESVYFSLPGKPQQPDELEPPVPVLRLSFQAVTTLVLATCGSGDGRGKSSWDIDIDAPRLRSFRYKGLIRRFVLRRRPAAPPGVARVDLHFLKDNDLSETIRTLFWQFLHNFSNARTIKLKVDNDLRDIAAVGEASAARLLRCAFPGVERLELEGRYCCYTSETAAVAIANLLHCCPALGHLMLKLSALSDLPLRGERYGEEFLNRKDRSDYGKSIDRFLRRRKSKTAAMSVADSIFFGDRYSYDDVPGIPGLSGCSFACLQRTLRRVGLEFRLDNYSISSCLGLRLIKFFGGHARVLEEMCVDSGNRRLDEHLNFNVETQMALASTPSIQHRNLAESSSEFSRISRATLDSTIGIAKSTAGFTVLPLQRQEKMDRKSVP